MISNNKPRSYSNTFRGCGYAKGVPQYLDKQFSMTDSSQKENIVKKNRISIVSCLVENVAVLDTLSINLWGKKLIPETIRSLQAAEERASALMESLVAALDKDPDSLPAVLNELNQHKILKELLNYSQIKEQGIILIL